MVFYSQIRKAILVFNNKKIIDYHCKLEYNSEHE